MAWTAPSHHLNQCWNIVNWTLGNKFQWNPNRNSNIFIQGNSFENGVYEMAPILSRPQCVKYNITRQRTKQFQIYTCVFNDDLAPIVLLSRDYQRWYRDGIESNYSGNVCENWALIFNIGGLVVTYATNTWAILHKRIARNCGKIILQWTDCNHLNE